MRIVIVQFTLALHGLHNDFWWNLTQIIVGAHHSPVRACVSYEHNVVFVAFGKISLRPKLVARFADWSDDTHLAVVYLIEARQIYDLVVGIIKCRSN